jgi:hypothetical protein
MNLFQNQGRPAGNITFRFGKCRLLVTAHLLDQRGQRCGRKLDPHILPGRGEANLLRSGLDGHLGETCVRHQNV